MAWGNRDPIARALAQPSVAPGVLSSLAELLSPLTVTEFQDLRHRRELAYRPRSNADAYAPLLGWASLRDLLHSGKHPPVGDGIRVTKESHMVPPERWVIDGKVDASKLDGYLASGFSVVVHRVEKHVPALAAVCEEIRTQFQEGSYVAAVVTSGVGAGAFKIHFDPEDLIILQLEGTKRWQVFGPVVPNPLRGMPKQRLEVPAPILDEVLEPGDLLFVPAGYWHHCESGLSTSVHLGIFFLPPTGWHAINEVVRPLIADELFRKPLSRLDGQAGFAAMEAEIKNQVIEKIRALKFEEFVARWPNVAY